MKYRHPQPAHLHSEWSSDHWSAQYPVLKADARDTLEVTGIARHDDRIAGNGDGADEQIRVLDPPAEANELRLGITEELHRRQVQVQYRERRQEPQDLHPGLRWRLRFRSAVEELRSRDPGRRDLVLLCGSPQEHGLDTAQDGDAGVGVEDSQRSTSRPPGRRL